MLACVPTEMLHLRKGAIQCDMKLWRCCLTLQSNATTDQSRSTYLQTKPDACLDQLYSRVRHLQFKACEDYAQQLTIDWCQVASCTWQDYTLSPVTLHRVPSLSPLCLPANFCIIVPVASHRVLAAAMMPSWLL
jgi:hypothetical protein